MEAVMGALENIEKIIYRILIAVILIPKTLLLIVLQPDYAPEYIHDELGKGESRFDEYVSPIVLLLVVALVPFVVFRFIPASGVKITSAYIDNPKNEWKTDFDAEVRFVSAVTDSTADTGFITTYWRVERENILKVDKEVVQDGVTTVVLEDKYFYPTLEQIRHTNYYVENAPKENTSGKKTSTGNKQNFVYDQVDNHTIMDAYPVSVFAESAFKEPGNYWVVFNASKFDNSGKLIETFESNMVVHVPEGIDENVTVDMDARSKPGEEPSFSFDEVANQLKSENTILLALGLLIPPLLFALVTKLIGKDSTGKDSSEMDSTEQNSTERGSSEKNPPRKDLLNEDSLRETFYIQCYYFAPLAFMFWATRYAGRFLTPDVFFHYEKASLIILLPIILVVVWFISVQTRALVNKRGISLWLALPIVLVCMLVLVGGVLFILFSNQPLLQDRARTITIWLYPLLVVVLLASYYKLASFWRNEKNQITKEKKATPLLAIYTKLETFWQKVESQITKGKQPANIFDFDKVLAWGFLLIIFITLIWVGSQGKFAGLSSIEFDNTQQSAVTQSIDNLTKSVAGLATSVADRANQTATANALAPQTQVLSFTPTVEVIPTNQEPASTPTPLSALPVPSSDTSSTPSSQEAPTVTLTPEVAFVPSTPAEFYTEEFDEGLNNDAWYHFVVDGEETDADSNSYNGKLNVSIKPNDNGLSFYLVNNVFSYKDVQVETTSGNIGANSNAVSLICRASGAGWYEFEVDNLGYYTIYAYDGSYNTLVTDYLSAINPDSDTNKYTAICSGNNLLFFVNDSLIAQIQDDRFTEGYIGLSVFSAGEPVNVDFEYIKVSEP